MTTLVYSFLADCLILTVGWIVLHQHYVRRLGAVRHAEFGVRRREEQASRLLQEAQTTKMRAEDAVDAMAVWTTSVLPEAPAREAFCEHLFNLAFEHPEELLPSLRSLPTGALHTTSGRSADAPYEMPLLPDLPIPISAYQQYQQERAEALRDRVRMLRNSGHIPAELLSGADVSQLRKADAIRLLLRYDPECSARCAAA